MGPSQHAILALATVFALGGCASLSAEDCRAASWYQLGWRDGEISWYSSLDQYAKKCAPYGVKPDAAQYEQGRVDGHQDERNRAMSH
jgi:hypothetical protein